MPMGRAEMAPDQQGYDSMVLASYRVPWFYNTIAALSSWILLAGFIFPQAAPLAAPFAPPAEGSVRPLTAGMREAPLILGAYEWLGATRIPPP